MVRNIRLFLLVMVLACPAAAPGDTVYLQNGKTVDGKIEKLEQDKLHIRTPQGLVEYGRDEVKSFSIERPGPDGKPVVARLMFKPKPLKMPFEIETEHYLVKTDTAEHVCKNAANAMEMLYKAYSDIFNLEAEAPKDKTDVIIFDKQESFTKYAESLNAKPHPGTLGFFRHGPTGSQIVTYKRRTDEFHTLSTLYHEGTHQFIMMVMGEDNEPPLWVNEGLAVYFENSEWRRGKFKTGIIPRQRLLLLQQRLRSGEYVRLADLMKRRRDTYDMVCYSEGWSLVYFFVKAHNGAYAKRFGKYFKMLKEKKDPDEAFKTCFTDDLDKLERAWKTFVLRLKVPSK